MHTDIRVASIAVHQVSPVARGLAMLLTAKDRCGSGDCGAQAYVKAVLNGADLLFCGHHYRLAVDKLVLDGADIVDERPPEMRW